MKKVLMILLCGALPVALTTSSALAEAGKPDHLIVPVAKVLDAKVLEAIDQKLYDYQVFELDTREIDRQVRLAGRLNLYLGNRHLELDLEPNDLRAPDYRRVLVIDGQEVEQDPGPVITFKGRVVGDESSVVRLTVTPKLMTGYVKTEHEWLLIDPVTDFHKGAKPGDVVVYEDKAVRPDHGGTCGATEAHRLPGRAEVLGQHKALRTKAFEVLQVATECDGQYYADYGNPGVFNRITGILNDVEGIYESEINTTISITYQHCWTSISGDPYTSLDASTSLTQFKDWWNSNKSSITRDTTHKFSGKDFSGSTIGIAYVGVICNAPSWAYGISQDMSSSSTRRRLTAHEIGHNFSAGHDNQAPVCSGVSCSGSGPIMCSSIQTGSSSAADDFSSCSKSDINSHISTYGSCL